MQFNKNKLMEVLFWTDSMYVTNHYSEKSISTLPQAVPKTFL